MKSARAALGPVAAVVMLGVLGQLGCNGRAKAPGKRAPHASLPRVSPVAENARCATCHADIARAWRGSSHAEAFRIPPFKAAYALEPFPLCAECHAPLASATRPTQAESDLGVACTTCHPGGARLAAGTSADAVCARCHEFPFPGETRLVQKTVTEHEGSGMRDVACVDCHMSSDGRGHSDHRFFVTRNEEFVRAAARISAERQGDALVFRFERAMVGHAFPTGDLFRRLHLVATGTRGGARATVERGLSRKAKLGEDADDRPFAGGADVAVARVPLSGLEGPLVWRVVYERVQRPHDLEEREVDLDGAIEVASGRIE